MATITPVKLSANVGAGTFTTDMSTLAGVTEHVISGFDKAKKICLYADNTSSQKAITVNASDFGVNRGQGAVTFTLPQNIPMSIALEGARVLQSDGTIVFTVASSMTGDLSVFELPN